MSEMNLIIVYGDLIKNKRVFIRELHLSNELLDRTIDMIDMIQAMQ